MSWWALTDAKQVTGFSSTLLNTTFKAPHDHDSGYIHLLPCSYLYPGRLTFFFSPNKPSLYLPPRLGIWSSLCLESSPPDLQKSHSFSSLRLCSDVISSETPCFSCSSPNHPIYISPCHQSYHPVNWSGLARLCCRQKTTFKSQGLNLIHGLVLVPARIHHRLSVGSAPCSLTLEIRLVDYPPFKHH